MRKQPDHFDLLYSQSSGDLYLADEDDFKVLLARGYSGRGEDRDNPLSERKVAQGPIPRGVWKVRTPYDHPTLGPLAFPLTPFHVPSLVGPNGSGRAGFFIHGDNRDGNFSASKGCIILPRNIREVIRSLSIATLTVEGDPHEDTALSASG